MSCSHQELVHTWERQGAGADIEPNLQKHLDGCAMCAAHVEDVLSMRALVANLPAPPLSEDQAVQMRIKLIAIAQERSSNSDQDVKKGDMPDHDEFSEPANDGDEATSTRRGLWALVAVAAVLLVGVGFVLRGWTDISPRDTTTLTTATSPKAPTPSTKAGFWIAEEDAQVDQLSTGPNEVVWLRHGAAWFKVNPLPKGSVFRVIAGDGEVEVVGTRFRVEVEYGRLQSVQVAEGRVLVRTQGQPTADLTAGERWRSPAVQQRTNEEKTTTDPITPAQNPSLAVIGKQPTAPKRDKSLTVAKTVSPTSHESTDINTNGDSHTRKREVNRANLRPKKARQPAVRQSAVKRQPQAKQPNVSKEPVQREPQKTASQPNPQTPSREVQQPLAPPSIDERFAEAWSLYQSGQFQAASRKLDMVSKIPQRDNARRAEILYWAAKAHLKAGSKSQATHHLKHSLQLSPKGWWADDARHLLRTLTAVRE